VIVPQKYNLSPEVEKTFPLSSNMRLKEKSSPVVVGVIAVVTIKSPFPFDLEKKSFLVVPMI
jgi:hypothetical protein